jgi:flagellar hook-associated protein 2
MSIPPISISGLASGMDTSTIIQQLMNIERLGLTRLQTKKNEFQSKQSAWQKLNTKLESLLSAAQSFASPINIKAKTATSSNESVLTVAAASSASVGTYAITINNRSTASKINGNSDVARPIVTTALLNTPDSLGSSLKYGTFTINGVKLEVLETDTLDSLFARINAVPGLSASYDAGSDKVTISSAGPVILGAGSDTSNIFQSLQLTANGIDVAVTSSRALGRIDPAAALNASGANGARSVVAVTGDDAGNGFFNINDKSIDYNVNTDSINDIITRINESEAGVRARYDVANGRLMLTNNNGGTEGIYVSDSVGNFVNAFGLDNAVTLGSNASVTIDGATFYSTDDVFTAAETGIAGLTFTIKADEGTATVGVGADKSNLTGMAKTFVDAYNDLMTTIGELGKIAGTEDKRVLGPLQGDQFLSSLKTRLRSMLAGSVGTLPAGFNHLGGVGIATSGIDAKLNLDSSKMGAALEANPDAVANLLGNADYGIIQKFKEYIQVQSGYGTGPIGGKSSRLDADVARVNKAIEAFNRQLERKELMLRAQFTAMETAVSTYKSGLNSLLSQLSSSYSSGSQSNS